MILEKLDLMLQETKEMKKKKSGKVKKNLKIRKEIV